MEHTKTKDFCTHFASLAAELGPLHTASFLAGMTVLELPAQRSLIRDRMPVDSLYLIVKGSAEVSVGQGRDALVLGTLGPGQWLGEVSALSGEHIASATISTLTAARFLRMRHPFLEELISTNQAVAAVLLPHLVLMLADRLRKSYQSELAMLPSLA